MNFNLNSPGDPQYNKIMMKKHMEQSRRWREGPSEILSPLALRNHSQILPDIQPSPPPPKRKTVNQENQKMKRLYRDQIEESLLEAKKKKEMQWMEDKQTKRAMATENGVLDYLQKEIEKRDTFINGCWKKQEKMHNFYIDQQKAKHQRAMQHINLNYDADVFNHLSDQYQAMQKNNQSQVCQTNSVLKQLQLYDRQLERSTYGTYLNKDCRKIRHNPITNPIEYHIENPYLQARLSRY